MGNYHKYFYSIMRALDNHGEYFDDTIRDLIASGEELSEYLKLVRFIISKKENEKVKYYQVINYALKNIELPKVEEVNKFSFQNSLTMWQKAVQKHGTKFTHYFSYVGKIMKNNSNFKIEDITKELSKLLYKGADRFPELAELVVNHHPSLAQKLGYNKEFSQISFDKAVEIFGKVKEQDNLPNITVSNLHNDKVYHLVKLPIDDPRGFILGILANSCQDIGDGRKCWTMCNRWLYERKQWFLCSFKRKEKA